MRLFLDSVGCRLNISELEHTARLVQAAGWELAHSPEDADVILINTCTVTAKAAADSRKMIRHANRVSSAPIIVTGCWSTLSPEKARKLPGVAAVIPNAEKEQIVEVLLKAPQPQSEDVLRWLQDYHPDRLRTRSFVKVQDGCNHRCAYCITTLARGRSRSRPIHDVLNDIRSAALEGVQEVVLTGVHLGMWGRDLSPEADLVTLIKTVLSEMASISRLHLSSLEPWDLPAELFRLWKDDRLVKHLHMPLQSGSSTILRRMGRKVTLDGFARLLADVRSQIPDVAITTDLIAGFPGEREADHQATLAFVHSLNLAGGHVFPYSEREGTPAARMAEPVHHACRKERAAQLRTVLAASAKTFKEQYVGTIRPVLWIQERKGMLQGMTDNEIKVFMKGHAGSVNHIEPVKLQALHGAGMTGIVLDDSRLFSP